MNNTATDSVQPDDITPDNITPDDEDQHWVRVALDAAEEKLGTNNRAFFVGESIGITDWFAVTSGNNGRQVRAIVDEVEEQVAKAGGPRPKRVEGKDTLSWVLMDYGAFVVHVFDSETRDFYDLERLWRDMPELTR